MTDGALVAFDGARRSVVTSAALGTSAAFRTTHTIGTRDAVDTGRPYIARLALGALGALGAEGAEGTSGALVAVGSGGSSGTSGADGALGTL